MAPRDLTQVVIHAKMEKQTKIIQSEGHRDRMVKEAEGEAARMISQVRVAAVVPATAAGRNSV